MTPSLTRRFQHYCIIPDLNITVSSAPYEHTTFTVFDVPQAFHGSTEMALHWPWVVPAKNPKQDKPEHGKAVLFSHSAKKRVAFSGTSECGPHFVSNVLSVVAFFFISTQGFGSKSNNGQRAGRMGQRKPKGSTAKLSGPV
ncbi:hypothetical protein GT037_005718, partial [Alternaria burnsii]